MTPRRFKLSLAGIALLALALRIAYGLIADVPNGLGDDVWYHQVANGLAHGRGFSDPFNSITPYGGVDFGTLGQARPTAFHLPLFPALLALFSSVGIDSYTAHQVVGCALGAATVVVCGLVGRRLAGEWAGLAAAAVAAVFLPLVIRDSLLMSESLYGLLIALALLATLRLRDEPSARRALELGVVLGLAALTRSEALLLVLLLALPAVRRPRRLAHLAIVAAAVALLCVPWAVRNSLEFDQPTLLTTGDGSVLAGANLPSTYHGELLGAWDVDGLYKRTAAGRVPSANEAVQSDRWRSEALDYVGDHAGRLPVVMAARVLRTWDLYPFDPRTRATFAASYYNHVKAAEYLVLPMLLLVTALALFGVVALRRRAVAVWPFAAPIVLVVLVSAAGYGDTRFRQAPDVALVILAGAGLAMARERWTGTGRTGRP